MNSWYHPDDETLIVKGCEWLRLCYLDYGQRDLSALNSWKLKATLKYTIRDKHENRRQ